MSLVRGMRLLKAEFHYFPGFCIYFLPFVVVNPSRYDREVRIVDSAPGVKLPASNCRRIA